MDTCGCILTRGLVEGVAAQSKRDAAPVAAEAAAVEEPALRADALQHVHPLATEVALLTVHRLPVHTGLRLWGEYWGETWHGGDGGLRRLWGNED